MQSYAVPCQGVRSPINQFTRCHTNHGLCHYPTLTLLTGFVPILDGIHSRLGKRRKTVLRKGLLGAVIGGVTVGMSGAGGDGQTNNQPVEVKEVCGKCGLGFGSRTKLFQHLRAVCDKTTSQTTDASTGGANADADAASHAGGASAANNAEASGARTCTVPPNRQKSSAGQKGRAPPELSPASRTLWFGGTDRSLLE